MSGGLFAMPRQPGGRASTAPAADGSLAGVSSFAFQGTNAHAVVSPVDVAAQAAAATAPTPAMPAWQRQFTSVVPPVHPQVATASVAGAGMARRVTFAMRLGSQACHAFFCSHQVSGKLIFPGKRSCWCLVVWAALIGFIFGSPP